MKINISAEDILNILQSSAFETFYEGEDFNNYIHGTLDSKEEDRLRNNLLLDIDYLFTK